MNTIEETQKMNQKWLWILLISIQTLLIYKLIIDYIEKSIFQIIPVIIVTITCVFIYSIKLKYIINSENIIISFFPFLSSSKKIEITEIKKISIIEYKPLKDYGGWGLRYGSNSTAYTIKGQKGIYIEMNNGKNLLIGTQLDIDFLYKNISEITSNNINITISKQ